VSASKGELGLGTVFDWKALVGRETWFGWMRMLEFDEKVLDITWHTDATAATDKVPFDVNARKVIPCHVELHTMAFFERIKEMVKVFNSDIFDSKVIHKETEFDGTPFVAPEARCGSRFKTRRV
jgi:hypothetical protein